jgi:serine/threonine-protein kinase
VAGYWLEEQIGQGGMAVVFRARDERLARQVALKVLSPALAADEEFRRRFIRESRSAAAVDHPHIIPVFEAGEAAGVLFLAMRYVPGGDAGSLVRREGPLGAARAAGIIAAAASALDAAHAAGLVHRDVKPGNMLIDARPGHAEHVYLSDFGLTKGAASSALTGTGYFLGTLDYCAPEQISGGAVDGRTDEYALACAAFELLAGRPPYARDDAMAVLYAQLSAVPPLLAGVRPDLPAGVDGVLRRALAKAPGDRYASCGEFAAALGTALGLPGCYPAPDHPARWAAHQQDQPTWDVAPRPGAAAMPGTADALVMAGTTGPRSPGTGGTGRPARTGARRLGWVSAVVGIAVMAAAGAAVAAVVLTSNSSEAAGPSASAGTYHPAGSTNGPVNSTQGQPGSTDSPAGSATGTPGSTAGVTPAASSQAAAPPQAVSTPSPGMWIAQLASVPASAGLGQLQQELAQVQTEIPGAQYLDSSDYASLNPGFWVVYYAGSFSDGNQALLYCAAHGRATKNECVGRFLSNNTADKSYICFPPADSQATGCTRPGTTAFTEPLSGRRA